MISRKEFERIQLRLNHSDAESIEKEDAETEDAGLERLSLPKHYSMTFREILFASLTSFSLIVPLSVMMTLYFKIDDLFSIGKYRDRAIHYAEKSWIVAAITVIAVFLLTIIIGICWKFVQYGNYEVMADKHRIYIQKGLFNHTEFSIVKEKVQAIKINKSLLRRGLGMGEVKLVSAGGTGKEDIEIASTLFPFISEDKAVRLVSELLPGYLIDRNNIVKLPKTALFVKLVRPSYLWLITTAILLYFWPKLWYLSLALLVIIVCARLLHAVNSSYSLKNTNIQFKMGAFATELFVTNRMKIEEMEISESWLQRQFGLASVKISTRSKPIHFSSISDIPRDAAVQYYQWYARHRLGTNALRPAEQNELK